MNEGVQNENVNFISARLVWCESEMVTPFSVSVNAGGMDPSFSVSCLAWTKITSAD